jgi:hypothetical protein
MVPLLLASLPAQATYQNLNGIVCSACTCLVVTLLFYLFRPSDEDTFVDWWPRGRWALLLALLATIVAIIITFVMAGGLLAGQW